MRPRDLDQAAGPPEGLETDVSQGTVDDGAPVNLWTLRHVKLPRLGIKPGATAVPMPNPRETRDSKNYMLSLHFSVNGMQMTKQLKRSGCK